MSALTRPDRLTGFIAAGAAAASLFAASAVPIPLLTMLRDALHLTNASATATTAGYFLGCTTALIGFSGLSNRIGRKLVTIAALFLSIASLECLLHADSFTGLLVSRIIQGFAGGLVSSAALAWFSDLALPERPNLAAAGSAGLPSIGFCVGAPLAGLLADQLGFAAFELSVRGAEIAIGTAACLALIAPETLKRRALEPKPTERRRRAVLAVPAGLREYFPKAAAAFAATWSFSSFGQSFASPFCEHLGLGAAAGAAGLFYAAFILPNACGGLLLGKFKPKRLDQETAALMCFSLAAAACLLGFSIGFAPLFFTAMFAAGIFAGLTCAAVIKSALERADAEERPQALSVLYLSGYFGSALSGLMASFAAASLPLEAVALLFICWLAGLFVFVRMRNRRAAGNAESNAQTA